MTSSSKKKKASYTNIASNLWVQSVNNSFCYGCHGSWWSDHSCGSYHFVYRTGSHSSPQKNNSRKYLWKSYATRPTTWPSSTWGPQSAIRSGIGDPSAHWTTPESRAKNCVHSGHLSPNVSVSIEWTHTTSVHGGKTVPDDRVNQWPADVQNSYFGRPVAVAFSGGYSHVCGSKSVPNPHVDNRC